MEEADPSSPSMSSGERRAAFSLASILALRMLGLFMVLPVFTLHAEGYTGYTPFLAGLAIGIYGLTQALFQLPFGIASDRLGRRPVILTGLLIFAAGSVLAALADSMFMVIAGRALQGLGAVGAVVLALAADLTREEHRTKTMAVIGVSIGLSFALSMVLGPALAAAAGISGLFWATCALALGGIVILQVLVPRPRQRRFHRDTQPVIGQVGRVLADPQLLRLDAGIFTLHLAMTATFVALPAVLRDHAGLEASRHALFYLTVLPLSILVMAPLVRLADRPGRLKPVFLGAIAVLALAQAGLAGLPPVLWLVGALMVAYFSAFNVLEASLPSLVSRIAPGDIKGTALGVYSSCQYLGAFAGGAAGGWILGHGGPSGVFAVAAVAAVGWGALALGQRAADHLSTRLIRVGPMDEAAAGALGRELERIPGVQEAVVNAESGVAYLKVNRDTLEESALSRACDRVAGEEA